LSASHASPTRRSSDLQVTKDAIRPGGVTSEPTQFLLGRSGKDRFQVGAYIGGPGQLYRQFPVTWGVGSQFGVGRVDAGLDLGGGRTIAEASVDTALGGPKGCVALPGGTQVGELTAHERGECPASPVGGPHPHPGPPGNAA